MLKSVLPKGAPHRLACQVCLVTTALLALGLAGCTKDPQDESIAKQIVGEYYLNRVSGGIAGINDSFSVETSPSLWRFDDGGGYRFINRQPGAPVDTIQGTWFMTNVYREGDTLGFEMLLRDDQGRKYDNGTYQLIGTERLVTSNEGSDRLYYTYVKR